MTQSDAIAKYKPEAPVGNIKYLSALLKTAGEKLDALAPAGKREAFRDRLMQLALLAANKQPKILQCTQASVIQAVMDAAQTGLDISTARGEAALVPYFDKGQRANVCQFIPMYRGLARLARNSGEVKRIEAEVVYANDRFTYRKGSVVEVSFEPMLAGDRGRKIGVYALAEYRTGAVQAVFLSADDVEKVRAVSKMGKSGPWVDWEEEMWKKTAFRNLAKWLTLDSDRFYAAVEAGDREYDLKPLEREDQDVNRRLGLGEGLEDVEPPEWLAGDQEGEPPAEK